MGLEAPRKVGEVSERSSETERPAAAANRAPRCCNVTSLPVASAIPDRLSTCTYMHNVGIVTLGQM